MEKIDIFQKRRSTRVPMSFAAKGKKAYRKRQKLPPLTTHRSLNLIVTHIT